MKILAIDLGKFNSVACIYDGKITKNRFQKFNTAPGVLHDLLVVEEPDLLLIEVCSMAGWVCDMAETLNIEIKVANTNEDKFKWKNTKRKTDKDDALRLIEMYIVNRFSTVPIPKIKTRQRRAMIKGRKAISGRITSIKNNIRAILDRQGLAMGKGKSGWTKQSIVYLRSLAVEPQKSTEDHLWRSMLRGILVEACWLGMRYNPWIRETYEKICRGDKNRRKIAIVAVARQLFVRLWAMMRDNKPWREKLLYG